MSQNCDRKHKNAIRNWFKKQKVSYIEQLVKCVASYFIVSLLLLLLLEFFLRHAVLPFCPVQLLIQRPLGGKKGRASLRQMKKQQFHI